MMFPTQIYLLLAFFSFVRPQSSCTVTPATPPPAGSQCGTAGSLTQPAQITTFQASSSGVLTAQQVCRDSCIDRPSCLSFAFNAGTRRCRLYSKSLKAQGFAASSTSDKFYSRNCFTAAARPCPGNLFANGGFETGTFAGWQRYDQPAAGGAKHTTVGQPGHCSGDAARFYPLLNQFTYLQQNFTLATGQAYAFSVDYMWQTANFDFVVEITTRRDGDFNGYILGERAENASLAGVWQSLTYTLTPASPDYGIVLDAGHFSTSKQRTVAWFDNLCLRRA